jgi:hypothetical protein
MDVEEDVAVAEKRVTSSRASSKPPASRYSSARSRKSTRNKSAKASSPHKMSALEFVALGSSGYQVDQQQQQQQQQLVASGINQLAVSRKASAAASISSRRHSSSSSRGHSRPPRTSCWKSWHRVGSCSSSVRVSNGVLSPPATRPAHCVRNQQHNWMLV